jgi:hypothetical protein
MVNREMPYLGLVRQAFGYQVRHLLDFSNTLLVWYWLSTPKSPVILGATQRWKTGGYITLLDLS